MTPPILVNQHILSAVFEHHKGWRSRAMWTVRCLRNFEGTGEDLRVIVAAVVGNPKHHNHWGAIILALLKEGILVETGEYRAMKGEKSHGRRTQVLRTKTCN